MKTMIAFCGLDCEKCDAYIAAKNDDQALREPVRHPSMRIEEGCHHLWRLSGNGYMFNSQGCYR